MRDPLNGYGLTILVFLESADPAFLSTCNFLLYSVYLFNFLLVAFECMADHPSSLITCQWKNYARKKIYAIVNYQWNIIKTINATTFHDCKIYLLIYFTLTSLNFPLFAIAAPIRANPK